MRGCLPTTGSSVVETPTMTKKKSKMDIDENIDVYSIPKCMRLLEKYCEVLSRLALMVRFFLSISVLYLFNFHIYLVKKIIIFVIFLID